MKPTLHFIKEAGAKIIAPAFLLLISIHILILGAEIYATVLIPEWRHYFYGIIEQKDSTNFISGLLAFLGIIVGITLAQTLKTWLSCLIGLRIRTGLTKVLQKSWCLNLAARTTNVDNPDQRINEDCKLAASNFLEVLNELIISSVIVVLLIAGTRQWDMLLAALVYTLIVGVIIVFFR